MFKNMRVGWFKVFDKNSLWHLLFSAILSALFGFLPSFLFGVYYDVSQSYMRNESFVKHWTKWEKMLFSSNNRTDLFDILWNIVGCAIGGYIRLWFGAGFYL